MSRSNDNTKTRRTRSLVLVMLAWVFIGAQALLAAGSAYDYNNSGTDKEHMAWGLLSQGANRMRLVAMQAQPEVLGDVAIYLSVANALGLAALILGLLSWSRSKHTSGKLTIAAAVIVVLVNSLLNLPYA